jgi:hypothetical protein
MRWPNIGVEEPLERSIVPVILSSTLSGLDDPDLLQTPGLAITLLNRRYENTRSIAHWSD